MTTALNLLSEITFINDPNKTVNPNSCVLTQNKKLILPFTLILQQKNTKYFMYKYIKIN